MEDKGVFTSMRWKQVHKQSKTAVQRNPARPLDHSQHHSGSKDNKLSGSLHSEQSQPNLKVLNKFRESSQSKLSDYEQKTERTSLKRMPSYQRDKFESQYGHGQSAKTLEELKFELQSVKASANKGKQMQICILAEKLCEKYEQELKNLKVAKNQADANLVKLKKKMMEANLPPIPKISQKKKQKQELLVKQNEERDRPPPKQPFRGLQSLQNPLRSNKN